MSWFGNLFNALIGGIIMYIWLYIGMILSLFKAQQSALDGFIGVYESFAPPMVTDIYKNDFTYVV